MFDAHLGNEYEIHLAGYTHASVHPERNWSSKLRHVYENGTDSSNSTHSETVKLRQVYENGTDSSNSMHSETSELPHVCENGADSSNSMHSET